MPLALSSQSFPLSSSHAWRTAASSMSYSTATCTPTGHPKWSKFRPCTVFFVVFLEGTWDVSWIFGGMFWIVFGGLSTKKRPSGSKLPMWRLRWKVEGEKDQGFRPLDGVWCGWWSIIEHTTYTLPKFNILLMGSDIRLYNHLGCIKPCKYWNLLSYQLVSRISEPSTVAPESHGWLGRRSFPFLSVYMSVSENSGTPKSSILIGVSIVNHPFWGTPIFGNAHIFRGKQTAKLSRDLLTKDPMPPTQDATKATRGWEILAHFFWRSQPSVGVFFASQYIKIHICSNLRNLTYIDT